MSLTTRLSLFFLTTLAVVLLGFSSVLYLLVSHQVVAQRDERLQAAMQTLVAATEVHPQDVMWEPLERHVTLGEEDGDDQVRWMLHDSTGRLIDCSQNLEPRHGGPADPTEAPGGEGWRLLTRRIRMGSFHGETIEGKHGPYHGELAEGVDPEQLPQRATLPTDRTCKEIAFVIRVGLPWHPVAAALRQLALALAGVSAVLWVVAALLSRLVCRRALRPVIQMGASARALPGDEPGRLLPVPSTCDELEELGQAFNGVLRRLWEAMQRQQRFTGDASHQLRTPLAALLGQVEVALRQERTSAEYQRVLRLVERRGREMTQIVELLLFLARGPGRGELPETRDLNLADWLDEHLRPWSEHPRGADLHWSRPADGAAWQVRTQPALLGQLLDNLLDNACKYSEPGSAIMVELLRQPYGLELAVCDHGQGIHPEELPHVCDPFYRSPEARRLGRPGFGLGLAVAQEIARTLGASLHIDSQPGQGSRFSIRLPAPVVPSAPVAAATATASN
jgi:signal transduction histidine kinase